MPDTTSLPATAAEPAVTGRLTPVKIRDIVERLREPFDPSLIYFKPQVVSYKGENSTAKGAAYADARAYTDRLNEVVGYNGWGQSAVITTSPTYEKEVKKKEKNPETGAWDLETSKIIRTARISVVVTVTINGLGSHSNVGESEIGDENATTIAYAQAFKRACVEFGVGRYLYDLPETGWLAFDSKTKQFKQQPTLPDWAIPQKKCSDCRGVISPVQIGKDTYGVEAIIARSVQVHGRQLCGKCHQAASRKLQTASGKNDIGVGSATQAAA